MRYDCLFCKKKHLYIIMIVLSIPLLTWFVIASAMCVLVIVRICHKNYCQIRHDRHLFEIGSEREEFYIPGDNLNPDDEVYDCEDDD